LFGISPDDAKQGIFTHREEKASRKALPRPADQRKAEMVHKALQARRSPSERTSYRHLKPLDEDTLTASGQNAKKTTSLNLDPNQLSL
jgi:hypothetical protein